jgi:hypothetical protein
MFLTTWLDTDPATGLRKVYWTATGFDYVNFTTHTVSISSETGKSSGGVGIDIVQGKVGKGANAGCNIATNELNCDLRRGMPALEGFPRDQMSSTSTAWDGSPSMTVPPGSTSVLTQATRCASHTGSQFQWERRSLRMGH